MRGNIPGHHAARADDAAFPNRYAAAYHHVGGQPAVVLYGDGLCVTWTVGVN